MSTPFSPEELQRVAANRAALADAHAAREASIDTWLERLSDAEAVLMPLIVAGKRPVEGRWQETSTVDWDAIDAHLRRGGNIGAHLGASRWVGWDGDNAPATAAMLDAGFDLFTVSAGSRNPAYHHTGGAHVLWRLPSWVPQVRLTGPTKAVMLANGASIDVLAGNHQIVVPPSVVVIAEPRHYVGGYLTAGEASYCGPERDGWLKVEADKDRWLPELPLWALSEELLAYAPEGTVVGEPPAGWEPMAGAVMVWREAEARVREPGDSDDALTAAVDGLDLLSMLEAAGIAGERTGFDSCGPCETWLRAGSAAEKSITVHDCDVHGARVQVWTTAFAGLPQGGYSRLDAYAGLTGRELGAVMAELGLVQPRSLSFADQLDQAADQLEARAADPARCTDTVKRPDPAAVPQLVSLVDGVQTSRIAGEVEVPATEAFWRGEAVGMRSLALLLRGGHHHAEGAVLIGADSVVGAPVQDAPTAEREVVDAEVVEEATAASSSPSTAPAVDDAEEGEAVEEWEGGDQAMWRRHREIEAVLRGERDPETGLWQGMTPGLGRIANLSESRGIYMLGLTEAVLTRVSARIPPHVLFAPRSGIVGSRVEGLGLSYNTLLFGAPATGKTTTQVTAAGAVPMTEGIAEIPTGTAEGIVKAARVMVGGSGGSTPRQVMLATNVLSETDEVGNMLSELKRDGSRYIYFINGAFFGNTTLGQTTGEAHRRVSIPAHGARFSQIVGAQPQLCSPIWDTVGTGLDARFACAFTGSVSEEERGPLYHKPVPMLLPNGLPWDPPVGLPMGFRATGKTIEDDETGTSYPELEADLPERRDPEWIFWPKGSEEGRDAAEALSAHRSRFSRQAMMHDLDQRRTEGHEAVRTVKAAALLAALDGLKQPEEIHWRAALLLTEATILAAAESVAQSDAYDKASDKTVGARKGREYSAGKAAAESATADAVSDAADALYARLTRPTTGVRVGGRLAKGFGGSATYGQLTAASGISRRHRDYIPAGMQLLIQQERVSVAAAGNDPRDYVVTAVGRPAAVAAPAIGVLSA
ncbi:bifunctional DNA primase/polymerase [Tsukamurella tyrosinosolvens]|uniref:bifunctional DNA primase/polymerase n=1 Tax=Tsukamurella tyrosinosolvens TaxID=57704 RepID=UPI003680BABC